MNDKKYDGFLSFAIIVGAGLLFAKTADVMSYFSPTNLNDIVGSDVSLLYGIVTAAMVEGMILALHFNVQAANHPPAQWVKWLLIIVSGICQFYDGTIVTGNLSNQSDTLKTVFQFGVPIIPLLVVVMIVWIGKLPDADEPKKPFVGLANIPKQFDWIWYGPSGRPKTTPTRSAASVTYPSNTNAPKLDEPETANPTQRRNGANQ